MRAFAVLMLVIVMAVSVPAQTAARNVITDPAQIKSTEKFDIQPFTIDKLYSTRSVGRSAWSHDGRQIAFVSNLTGRNNIWVVSAESGWPQQLTVSNQRQSGVTWSPNGRWIAYTSDTDGNEQWDLFLVSPQSGQVINLTNTPEIAELGPVWSPNGESLAYTVKPKTSANFEVDVMEVLTKQVRHITMNTPKELSHSSPIWSRDGKYLVFTQTHANGQNSNIVMAEVATGKTVNLTPHEGDHTFEATGISPDGKTVLLTSNAHNGYDNAGLLDVASRKITWLTSDKWEIQSGRFSPDGKRLTWTANIDGNTDIFVYDLATGKASPLPVAPGVNSLAGGDRPFSLDGNRMLYIHNGPNAPQDLWVYNFTTGKSHQVTHSLVGGVRSEDMVEPFLVHFPSKDGKWQISALVYVPFNAERNGKNAAIVYIHGGPEAQTVNLFDHSVQYLVNQGYFVIAPNYRGSTGYGKEFMEANRFDMGGGDLEDVIATAEWIKKTGFIDPQKLIAMGASYGGYLTMMAVTKAPELWAAGVPIVPFVNWFTEMENEDPELREADLATMGDPVKNKQLFIDRSPINFIDRIKAPLLLLAGGHDPRCPSTEAEQVAQAVKKRNGIAELKIYENEGHGFAKLENQIDAYTRVAEFLKKHVPPAKCGCNIYD
jgi:dipeptidyl aminopeptidase/acylaminoacyl peptidase